MKSKIVLFLFALCAGASIGFAQGTAFTYQGRLSDSGAPANGVYDLQFTLRDALTAGNQIGRPVTVPSSAFSPGPAGGWRSAYGRMAAARLRR